MAKFIFIPCLLSTATAIATVVRAVIAGRIRVGSPGLPLAIAGVDNPFLAFMKSRGVVARTAAVKRSAIPFSRSHLVESNLDVRGTALD